MLSLTKLCITAIVAGTFAAMTSALPAQTLVQTAKLREPCNVQNGNILIGCEKGLVCEGMTGLAKMRGAKVGAPVPGEARVCVKYITKEKKTCDNFNFCINNLTCVKGKCCNKLLYECEQTY